jgi:creatinine amidohydrolase
MDRWPWIEVRSTLYPMSFDRRFGQLSAHGVADAISDSSILLQPIGAIEAHGPHLPMSTDQVIADHAVNSIVKRYGDELDLWSLPTLTYSKSNEHAWAPGTIWLSANTLMRVLDDVGRSIATTKAKKLVFVNAHGGNSALLQVVCRDLRLRYGLQTFLAHPYVATDEGNELGMGIHGGHDETSMLMAIDAASVQLQLAVRAVPEHLALNKHVRFGGSVSFGWLSNDFERRPSNNALPIGVIGDATNANAAHGELLWERVLGNLYEALQEIRDWNPSGI